MERARTARIILNLPLGGEKEKGGKGGERGWDTNQSFLAIAKISR